MSAGEKKRSGKIRRGKKGASEAENAAGNTQEPLRKEQCTSSSAGGGQNGMPERSCLVAEGIPEKGGPCSRRGRPGHMAGSGNGAFPREAVRASGRADGETGKSRKKAEKNRKKRLKGY